MAAALRQAEETLSESSMVVLTVVSVTLVMVVVCGEVVVSVTVVVCGEVVDVPVVAVVPLLLRV